MASETKNVQVTGFPSAARAITPSDSTDLTNQAGEVVAMFVRAESAGAISVVPAGNALADFVVFTLAAGEFVPVRCRRVRATGTTAASITGVW